MHKRNARNVGWMRVKSGWCVERGQTNGAWRNGVVVSVSEIRVRELEMRVRDWKIREEIGNLRVRVWQMWEVRFKRH